MWVSVGHEYNIIIYNHEVRWVRNSAAVAMAPPVMAFFTTFGGRNACINWSQYII